MCFSLVSSLLDTIKFPLTQTHSNMLLILVIITLSYSSQHVLKWTVKLIANRWAWGRCLWKRVVVPSEMRASSRARRYPRQPRERQPGTVTLRNSVEILTNLYTYHGQPRGREGEGQTAALMHKYELEIAWPQSEYASSNPKRRPVC